jgi:hypothetical protein
VDRIACVSNAIHGRWQKADADFDIAPYLLSIWLGLSSRQVIKQRMVYPKLNILDRRRGMRRIIVTMIFVIKFRSRGTGGYHRHSSPEQVVRQPDSTAFGLHLQIGLPNQQFQEMSSSQKISRSRFVDEQLGRATWLDQVMPSPPATQLPVRPVFYPLNKYLTVNVSLAAPSVFRLAEMTLKRLSSYA